MQTKIMFAWSILSGEDESLCSKTDTQVPEMSRRTGLYEGITLFIIINDSELLALWTLSIVRNSKY
jgi:hypothetical protein